MIYLDSAATSLQKPPAVARACSYAISHYASPGRGGHKPAMDAAAAAFACREAAARLFQVPKPEQVVFTNNATHGLNIAIKALVRPGGTVVISGYEHNAVTRPLHAIPDVTVRVAAGQLFRPEETVEAFRKALTPEVTAAVFTHVSNVFGMILPIQELARLCRERGVPFILDASQSAGCLPVHLEELGAAFIAMPGHKGLYGPQGTGLLLCGQTPPPLLEGGTGSESIRQEMPDFLPDRLDAGTHNIAGIAGLLEGLRFVEKQGVQSIGSHERALTVQMGESLAQLPGVEVFRSKDPSQQAGVLSFRVSGMDCEELGEALGRRDIALRSGLHCAPLAHRTAGTLETGTVRASVSAFNVPQEIPRFVRELRQILTEKP